ncbi:hypothetical protein [Natrinema salifodinae]|uniref:Uncharacterized protein n=1 Tax=Natrinema salifodinae TaxID=1202768 RepID=A0A1I0NI91_9EURY|nr:hypothetical protein [Natrinema salifodinae]SEW01161.1 hypothetical protein SAMN05216285_1766 [Natrinema salifodinae]
MNGYSLYSCDTPRCTGLKEVITPDGYLCEDCADELAAEYEDEGNQPTNIGVARHT